MGKMNLRTDVNGTPIPALAAQDGSSMERTLVAGQSPTVIDLKGHGILCMYSTGGMKFKMGDSNVTCTANDYDGFLPPNVLYDFAVKANATHMAVFAVDAGILYPHGKV